jgi:short-subunit dehydrogenase
VIGPARSGNEATGKVVLITGGSRGLGFAVASEFARRGARVAICGRDEASLDAARRRLSVRGGEVMAQVCDVGDREQIAALIAATTAQLGPIDILVNNAGVATVAPVARQTIEDFEEAMNVMFWAIVHSSLTLLPEMLERGDGTIVNVTSIGGKVASPHLLPYSCAKFAAIAFSDGLQGEVAQHGVRVLTVVPGFMRTGSQEHARFKSRASEEFRWFTTFGNVPVITMSAERAARRIVTAALSGRRQVLLGPMAQLVGRTAGVFPTLSALVLDGVNRLLPTEGDEGPSEGASIDHSGLPEVAARLQADAARTWNQRVSGLRE